LTTTELWDGVTYVYGNGGGGSASISPDGRFAAFLWSRSAVNGKILTIAGSQVELWDLETPRRVQVLYRDPNRDPAKGYDPHDLEGRRSQANPRRVLFNADSRKLAIIYAKGGIVIYDVPEGKESRRFGIIGWDQYKRARIIPAHCAAFSPDGRWLCFGGEEGRVDIGTADPVPDEPWAVTDQAAARHTGGRTSWKGHEGTVLALAVSPDSRMLATGGADQMIRLWELPDGRPLAQWEGHEGAVTALAFRLDGRGLVSGASDGVLKLWDLASIRRELAALGLDW
jgi:WD40 repeat protein